MDRQPTDTEIREFWEWCGLKYERLISKELRLSAERWIYPPNKDCSIGSYTFSQPLIDLNNIWRYAVDGKLLQILDIETQIIPLLGKWVEEVMLEDKDPALALFWAIYEVIKRVLPEEEK